MNVVFISGLFNFTSPLFSSYLVLLWSVGGQKLCVVLPSSASSRRDLHCVGTERCQGRGRGESLWDVLCCG